MVITLATEYNAMKKTTTESKPKQTEQINKIPCPSGADIPVERQKISTVRSVKRLSYIRQG